MLPVGYWIVNEWFLSVFPGKNDTFLSDACLTSSCEQNYTCIKLALSLLSGRNLKYSIFFREWNLTSLTDSTVLPVMYTVMHVLSMEWQRICVHDTVQTGTLCDPIWHASSLAVWQVRLRSAISIYFTLPSLLWCCWLGSGKKGICPVKNWVVGCWHGYLSGARCRLAYGPADAAANHCLLLQ